MESKDRASWLKSQQEKITFAKEIESWVDHPITNKLIEGMIDTKAKFLKVIDDIKLPVDSPEVQEARQKRSTIQWFIESLMNSVLSGERAEQEIKKYNEFESKKEKGGDSKK